MATHVKMAAEPTGALTFWGCWVSEGGAGRDGETEGKGKGKGEGEVLSMHGEQLIHVIAA